MLVLKREKDSLRLLGSWRQICGHSLRKYSEVSHGVQVSWGQSCPSQLTQAPPTLSPDILLFPARVQSPSVPTVTPSLGPLLSAHSLSICIPSPPPLDPPIPAPPASVIKEPDWSGCHAASFPTIWAQKPNRQLSD